MCMNYLKSLQTRIYICISKPNTWVGSSLTVNQGSYRFNKKAMILNIMSSFSEVVIPGGKKPKLFLWDLTNRFSLNIAILTHKKIQYLQFSCYRFPNVSFSNPLCTHSKTVPPWRRLLRGPSASPTSSHVGQAILLQAQNRHTAYLFPLPLTLPELQNRPVSLVGWGLSLSFGLPLENANAQCFAPIISLVRSMWWSHTFSWPN